MIDAVTQTPSKPTSAPPDAPQAERSSGAHQVPPLDPSPDPEASEDDAGSRGGAARKERVLHTRVPAVLEQELKNLAQSLRMPVSNVVRAILEDAVAAVDRVGRRAEGEVHRAANRLAEQRERLRTITGARPSDGPTPESEARHATRDGNGPASSAASPPVPQPPRTPTPAAGALEGVIGYQPLVLAKPAVCSRCGASLPRGADAFLGVRTGPGPQVLIGRECLPVEEEPVPKEQS